MIIVAGRYIFSILLCFSILLSVNVKAQNILPNGDFEYGLSNWDTYFASGYSGTLIQSSLEHSGTYAARINVTQVPSNPQALNAQLKTTNFHIESGHDYHLSMWLKADKNVDVQVILIKNTSPWTWLASKTVNLNTNYQFVDLLETSAPFTTSSDVRLAIRCGNKVAKIYVDDVVLTDCTPPSNYVSLHTNITGKGTITINDNSNENNCVLACNNQYPTNTLLTISSQPEPGYSFSGWSGPCSGTGPCQITLSQSTALSAHFSLSGNDNSILDYRNRTDWSNVGYDGDIPYNGNIIDMTQSPYNCIGNGTHNNYQSLLNALSDVANMSGFNIIYFPAGTYYIEGYESFIIPSNTVIRGECPSNTTLKIKPKVSNATNDVSNSLFQLRKYNNLTSGYSNIKGGYHKRSREIVVDNPSDFSQGDYIDLRQDNDIEKMNTNLVPNSLSASTFNNAYNNWGANVVGEVFKIKSIAGNRLIIDRGLHYTYDPKLNPRIKKLNVIENSGIENIEIKRIQTKEGHNIQIENCYNCWVRNIESDYTTKSHIGLARSYHVEIRDNYFHHSYDYGGGGHGYGVAMNHRSSNCLVENNIFYTLRHAMVLSYSPNGNVFGYNYSEESWDPNGNAGLGDLKADISLHGFYPLMNLFEGNVVEYIHSSDWWGPSGPGNTFFRNRANKEEFIISDNSDYQNVIANELTFDPFGFWQDNFDIHSSVDHTTKHSNNDLGDIDNSSKLNYLPNTLYKENNSPNFCNGFPYPQIGPVNWLSNNNGSYPYNRSKNPAEFRYKNATDKVDCLVPCSFNSGLLDSYSSCNTNITVTLNSENDYIRLYGVGIYSVPDTYGNETPDFYIKLYQNGTLLQNTDNNPVESDLDTYIKISSIILNASSNYEIKVYDKDLIYDDYLGSITFSGNSPQYYQTNFINGELLGLYLDKFEYKTRYLWNDGVVTNPRSFNQSGDYVVEITQGNGCVFYDSTVINLAGTPQTTGTHTWIGIDNDWFSNCNWSTYHVPNYNNDVVIPSGLTNYPIINGTGFVTGFDMNMDGSINSNDEVPGKAFCKTLEIENGAELEIQVTNGAELEIQF